MFLASSRAGLPLSVFVLACSIAPAAAADPPIAWRTDYNSARKEALAKNRPLLVVVGTEECFYCRKLSANTFRDSGILAQVAANFIPLKIDANRDPNLAKALKVQVYPTLVLAGPDGKIHNFLEGYLEADRLSEHMKRAIAATTTADWMARDYNEASKAIGAGDYPRAVSLLKGLIREAGDRPVGVKAKEVLAGVERQADGRLARARDLEQKGFTPEALDVLSETMRSYSGTRAAADAAALMAGIADKPEAREKQHARRARDLLAAAKDDFRAGRYYDCLQRGEQLALAFADRPESKEGAALAAEIKSNPDRLAAACEQMNEKTAAMYLALADSWSKKGQDKEAAACLEKVVKLCPNSLHANRAQTQLAKIRSRDPATATGFKAKP